MDGCVSFEYVAVIVTLVPAVMPKPAVLKEKAPAAGLESAAELSVKLASNLLP